MQNPNGHCVLSHTPPFNGLWYHCISIDGWVMPIGLQYAYHRDQQLNEMYLCFSLALCSICRSASFCQIFGNFSISSYKQLHLAAVHTPIDQFILYTVNRFIDRNCSRIRCFFLVKHVSSKRVRKGVGHT